MKNAPLVPNKEGLASYSGHLGWQVDQKHGTKCGFGNILDDFDDILCVTTTVLAELVLRGQAAHPAIRKLVAVVLSG